MENRKIIGIEDLDRLGDVYVLENFYKEEWTLSEESLWRLIKKPSLPLVYLTQYHPLPNFLIDHILTNPYNFGGSTVRGVLTYQELGDDLLRKHWLVAKSYYNTWLYQQLPLDLLNESADLWTDVIRKGQKNLPPEEVGEDNVFYHKDTLRENFKDNIGYLVREELENGYRFFQVHSLIDLRLKVPLVVTEGPTSLVRFNDDDIITYNIEPSDRPGLVIVKKVEVLQKKALVWRER